MKSELLFKEEHLPLLYKQRHECRPKRQRRRIYGGKELYQELQAQFLLFQPYLPEKLNNVLDIGSGLGFVDVVIHAHIPNLNYYLFDAMAETEGTTHAFYNNLKLTKSFLMLNGVPRPNIYLVDATSCGTDDAINQNPDCFKSLPKMDLVVSCYAWMWHRKASLFGREAFEVMNSGGLLAVDLNENFKDARQEIEAYGFQVVDVIHQMERKSLLIARK